jgi:DNA-binding Xre family transcriptional regulator
MIQFYLIPLIRAKGLKPNAGLLCKWGITRSLANRLIAGDVAQLHFKVVEVLCINLNCTPNDLLHYEPSDMPANSQSMLHSITKTTENAVNPVNAIQLLSPQDLFALNQYIIDTYNKKTPDTNKKIDEQASSNAQIEVPPSAG